MGGSGGGSGNQLVIGGVKYSPSQARQLQDLLDKAGEAATWHGTASRQAEKANKAVKAFIASVEKGAVKKGK
jgi:Cdc6-like AAA superfamily ATPase